MVAIRIFAGISAILLAACQHHDTPTPAVLVDGSDQSLSELSDQLASAMGVARVTLGAGDPTTTPSISVLPPALTDLEGRSTAMPTQFTLMLAGGECYAVRDETGDMIRLDGLTCRAL